MFSLNVYITHEHKLSYTHTGYYERLTFGEKSEFKIMSFEIFLKHMFLQYITINYFNNFLYKHLHVSVEVPELGCRVPCAALYTSTSDQKSVIICNKS